MHSYRRLIRAEIFLSDIPAFISLFFSPNGGIRSGTDVFKALALGADAVIIARPFVTAVYGGGAEGVAAYVEKIGGELADAMSMCGASSLKDISRDMVR